MKKSRTHIDVDLTGSFGGPLSVLPAQQPEADHESYLAIMPGKVLAAIYDRWGTRLLEQNVRVFLQHRGKVNKGIKATIENEPNMFFAYNNGITATRRGSRDRRRRGQTAAAATEELPDRERRPDDRVNPLGATRQG